MVNKKEFRKINNIPLEVIKTFVSRLNKNCKDNELKVIKVLLDNGPCFTKDIYDHLNRVLSLPTTRNTILRLLDREKLLVRDKNFSKIHDNGSIRYDVIVELKHMLDDYLDDNLNKIEPKDRSNKVTFTDLHRNIIDPDKINVSKEKSKKIPKVVVVQMDESGVGTNLFGMSRLLSEEKGGLTMVKNNDSSNEMLLEIDKLKCSVINSDLNNFIKKKLLDKLYEVSGILINEKGEHK